MTRSPLWIQGIARTGKTQHLVEQIRLYLDNPCLHPAHHRNSASSALGNPPPLIFAATGDNRLTLTESLTTALGPGVLLDTTTPLGFLRREVILYWPLLVEKGKVAAQFPLFLRSETEQELATQLWRDRLPELMALNAATTTAADSAALNQDWSRSRLDRIDPSRSDPSRPDPHSPHSQARTVRQLLDLFTLASSAGFPWTAAPSTPHSAGLPQFGHPSLASSAWWSLAQALGQSWQQWCRDQGFLTYGLVCDLYSQGLLSHDRYLATLHRRFPAIFADDLDEYPGIMAFLFQKLLERGSQGVFTFNPQGSVRLGFGADPTAFRPLQHYCRNAGQIQILEAPSQSLAQQLGQTLADLVQSGMVSLPLPGIDPQNNPLQVIQTTTRSQLLRDTADWITQLLSQGHCQPQDIAIITPGTDAIARYALLEILSHRKLPIQPLTEQRPLISVALVRALLTLLALVYPGLGRWVEREQVAELLEVLSQGSVGGLDPVRSGLLADHCYRPDLDRPQLLEVTAFPRWDRLGYRAAQAYNHLRTWIQQQRQLLDQGQTQTFVQVLDRAIQTFLWQGSTLAYDHLAALRELLETAQHYQEVAHRLPSPASPGSNSSLTPASALVQRFILLLRQGTLTANPYPTQHLGPQAHSITLATLFQYRLNRCYHRYQFWLDVGSPAWLTRGRGLWGASLFLHDRWLADRELADRELADRELLDRGPVDRELADRELLDRELTDRELTDRALTDRELTDRPNLGRDAMPETPGTPQANGNYRAETREFQDFSTDSVALELENPLDLTRSLLMEELRLEGVRLQQTVVDLLGRAGDRIYLCHSELSLGGQDQFGPLLPLVYVGTPIESP